MDPRSNKLAIPYLLNSSASSDVHSCPSSSSKSNSPQPSRSNRHEASRKSGAGDREYFSAEAGSSSAHHGSTSGPSNTRRRRDSVAASAANRGEERRPSTASRKFADPKNTEIDPYASKRRHICTFPNCGYRFKQRGGSAHASLPFPSCYRCHETDIYPGMNL